MQHPQILTTSQTGQSRPQIVQMSGGQRLSLILTSGSTTQRTVLPNTSTPGQPRAIFLTTGVSPRAVVQRGILPATSNTPVQRFIVPASGNGAVQRTGIVNVNGTSLPIQRGVVGTTVQRMVVPANNIGAIKSAVLPTSGNIQKTIVVGSSGIQATVLRPSSTVVPVQRATPPVVSPSPQKPGPSSSATMQLSAATATFNTVVSVQQKPIIINSGAHVVLPSSSAPAQGKSILTSGNLTHLVQTPAGMRILQLQPGERMIQVGNPPAVRFVVARNSASTVVPVVRPSKQHTEIRPKPVSTAVTMTSLMLSSTPTLIAQGTSSSQLSNIVMSTMASPIMTSQGTSDVQKVIVSSIPLSKLATTVPRPLAPRPVVLSVQGRPTGPVILTRPSLRSVLAQPQVQRAMASTNQQRGTLPQTETKNTIVISQSDSKAPTQEVKKNQIVLSTPQGIALVQQIRSLQQQLQQAKDQEKIRLIQAQMNSAKISLQKHIRDIQKSELKTGAQGSGARLIVRAVGNNEVGSAGPQAKAQKIIQQAIAKATAEGRNVPKATLNDNVMLDTPSKGRKATPKQTGARQAGGSTGRKPASAKRSKGRKRKQLPMFLKKRKRRRQDSSDEEKVEPSESESESDNSLIEKRRSSRHAQRKRYKDEVDLELSDSDSTTTTMTNDVNADEPPPDEANIVEKILGTRDRKVPISSKIINGGDTNETIDIEEGSSEDMKKTPDTSDPSSFQITKEYFVKYKNFSYLHCEWKSEAQLLQGDKRIAMKIRNYEKKRHHTNFDLDDGEYFNPEFVEVDRVLERAVTYEDGTDVVHYLVKWMSLPYEESTWELEENVPAAKIEEWNKFNEWPDEDQEQRPGPESWVSLKTSPVFKNGNTLRSYQLEGLNWLTFCYYQQQNCILADEMGLGKTIQTIAFLQEVRSRCGPGPYLVIVPLSTVGNWQREFSLWTDLNVVVYHGSAASRGMIQQYELYFRDENNRIVQGVYKFDVLVTTYEIIISDCEILSEIIWPVCVIDEAHRLKNQNCRLIEGLSMFELEHRVLLTGTPLQNNVHELYSLLHFLEPEQFSDKDMFLRDFGDLQTDEQVQKLKALLKPMMLRRLKEDVEKTLAPKEETIIEVELTNIQKKYYRAILEKNFTYLTKGGSSSNVPNLMNTMMELRKCCNHPFLITGAEDQILSESRSDNSKVHSLLVNSSGKMVLLDKLLPRLFRDNHKVLMFSQMIRVLDILEDYLVHCGYLYERIDGRITGSLRQAAIDRFNRPEMNRFCFLLCTRAGGLGINLTAADTVLIYDSDWNPQNDIQAQARCHRIGQSKAVKVYRLITRNTYEREMFEKASLKLGLDRAVLQSIQAKEKPQLSKNEIENLLKKGAYGAIMDDCNEGDKFCDEDIERILEKRTQVITLDKEEKNSTFSKASYSTKKDRLDINIDDPHFWEKWAKKVDIDPDTAKGQRRDLVIDLPRQRKQTSRYTMAHGDMSDLDSTDSEGEGRKSKSKARATRGRKSKGQGPFDRYTRGDCFKVEKNLLHFGWGRWKEMIKCTVFKNNRKLVESDFVKLSRAILFFSLQHYAGDQTIKSFIYNLIISPSSSQSTTLNNHEGLRAPVPRGRKGKQAKMHNSSSNLDVEMKQKFDLNPDQILNDTGYKKHLTRHSNKVLLRVRLLYYLDHEIIKGRNSIEELPNAPGADSEKPVFWWDDNDDKSLLLGTHKHGYENYSLMRNDPNLTFLDKCGPPEAASLAKELNKDDDENMLDIEVEEESKPTTPVRGRGRARGRGRGRGGAKKDVPRDQPVLADDNMSDKSDEGKRVILNPENYTHGSLPWPTVSELNTRLRRLITSFQRSHKKHQQQIEIKQKKEEKRNRVEAILKEREKQRRDLQQKWSRREETDFYRTVSAYGVVRTPEGQFVWENFRNLARLEKKYDQTLTEYFHAFCYMCRSVLGLAHNEGPPNPVPVTPISSERAARCLARIELLGTIRERIVPHPLLDQRLSLCQLTSELPDWWIAGHHDKHLLLGAAKHGIGRMEYNLMYDNDLAFKDTISQLTQQQDHEPEDDKMEVGERSALKPPKKAKIKTEFDADANASIPLDETDVKSEIKDEDNEDMDTEEGIPDLDAVRSQMLQPLASNPALMWPKDRTLIHRLESICHCVQQGEWIGNVRSLIYEEHFTPSRSGDGLKMTFKKKRKNQLEQEYMPRLESSATDSDSANDVSDADKHSKKKKRSWSPSNLHPDTRVPVINTTDGSVLVGDTAPTAGTVYQWLSENPDWTLAKPKPKKGRMDPGSLNPNALTGEENVWVVHRETGKRITGAKGPPLKHLLQWLERNPMFDVDFKWAKVIKAKGILPKDMEHRLLNKPGQAQGKPSDELNQYYRELEKLYSGGSKADKVRSTGIKAEKSHSSAGSKGTKSYRNRSGTNVPSTSASADQEYAEMYQQLLASQQGGFLPDDNLYEQELVEHSDIMEHVKEEDIMEDELDVGAMEDTIEDNFEDTIDMEDTIDDDTMDGDMVEETYDTFDTFDGGSMNEDEIGDSDEVEDSMDEEEEDYENDDDDSVVNDDDNLEEYD